MTARDPRTARTVAALEAALRESLREHPLDTLTVSALCRAAGVQRTSFYTHFESVAELLTAMLTEGIDALLDVPDAPGLGIADLADEFQRTLVAAFELVVTERLLFRAAFASDASAPLRRSLTTMFDARLDRALQIWATHGAAQDVDAPVARAFAAGGLTASVEAWALATSTDAEARAAAVRDQMAPWWPRVA
ncbi:TetR/AcrR family transcriptional regulator [Herbiconiux sp. YIM B11900]|uniref:TetR/AcrR family transcriptional regulator n=1 Tax=Herbiconiux sp. YIM B11900 TaxID=3404131 RepID=UPI003F828FF3